jgi:hypothetical protein
LTGEKASAAPVQLRHNPVNADRDGDGGRPEAVMAVAVEVLNRKSGWQGELG